MLVVDFHTLHAVDVLDFVDDVFLNGCRTHDVEDVGGSYRTVGEGCAGADDVVFLNEDLFRQGDEIFLDFPEFRGDGDLAVAAFDLAEFDFAVDL